jgi:hypothetical protein
VNGANLYATGNIWGGNLTSQFNVWAASNVNAANLYASGNISALSNVNGTNLYATGNIWGANLTSQFNVWAASNVNAANLYASGNISALSNVNCTNLYATGNIWGANISTGGFQSNTINTAITGTVSLSKLLIGGVIGTAGQVLQATGTGAGIQWGAGGAASQWTTGTTNIYYLSNVGIGTSVVSANLHVIGNIYSTNAISTSNIIAAGFTSNATNTNFSYDTLVIPYLNVSATANIISSNTIVSNVNNIFCNYNVWAASNVNTVNLYATGNIWGSNISTGGFQSNTVNTAITGTVSLSKLLVGGAIGAAGQTIVTSGTGAGVQWGTITSSQWTASGPTLQDISFTSGNVTVSNLVSNYNVWATSNVNTTNLYATGNISAGATANVNTKNLWATANISGVTLNASNFLIAGVAGTSGQVLQATGTGAGIQWAAAGSSGNAAGILVLPNASPPPTLSGPFVSSTTSSTYHIPMTAAANWTTYASSTSVQISTNGNFQFLSAGIFEVALCINATNQMPQQIAVGLSASDTSLPTVTNAYIYKYAPQVTQDATTTITIPLRITDTTKFYYLDITFGGLSSSIALLADSTYISVKPIGAFTPNPMLTASVVVSSVVTNQSTSFTATGTNYYIGMTNGGTVTLPLGSTLTAGKIFIIKDESGQAGSNPSKNITIQMSGADLLDGQSTTSVQLNYTSLQIMWTGSANRWSFI